MIFLLIFHVTATHCHTQSDLCVSLCYSPPVSPTTPAPTGRPCPAPSPPADGADLFSARGILSLIQTSTRRAYQQVLDVLDDNRRWMSPLFSLLPLLPKHAVLAIINISVWTLVILYMYNRWVTPCFQPFLSSRLPLLSFVSLPEHSRPVLRGGSSASVPAPHHDNTR